MDGDGGFAWLWGIAIIGGPLLLGAVLAWVSFRRRQARRRGDVAESQQERLDSSVHR